MAGRAAVIVPDAEFPKRSRFSKERPYSYRSASIGSSVAAFIAG